MNEYDLTILASEAHANAVNHGFWAGNPSQEHCIMLVLTEIAEAVEVDRCETDFTPDCRGRYDDLMASGYAENEAFEIAIKGCKYDELADVCIRLLDLAGNIGADFSKLNPCRYKRDFEKFTFTENAFGLAKGLTQQSYSVQRRIQFGIHYVREWCYSLGESIEWYIEAKMAYNKGREHLHGKRY